MAALGFVLRSVQPAENKESCGGHLLGRPSETSIFSLLVSIVSQDLLEVSFTPFGCSLTTCLEATNTAPTPSKIGSPELVSWKLIGGGGALA
jgi:hypothetical protein